MLRASSARMAPSKAHLFQRVHSPSFMGINWTRPSWMNPYNNFYPFSICAGNQTRYLTGPLGFGRSHNRTGRNHIRNIILIAPSAFLAGMLFFMADMWDLAIVLSMITQKPIPDSFQETHKKEMMELSRTKPGYLLKHKLGGQISIAGSEINIK